jgi:hypothetical protein
MELELKIFIEKYLTEKLEFRRMSIGRAARAYAELIGVAAGPFPAGISFLQFLKAQGVKRPTLRHLSRVWVGEYQAFLEYHCGTLRAQAALDAIRPFYRWCADNAFFLAPIDPPRLAKIEATPTHNITVHLSRRLS